MMQATTNFIKHLRNKPAISKIVAFLIKLTRPISGQLYRKWLIYGTYRLEFNGVNFLVYSEGDDHIASNLFYSIPWETNELRLFTDHAKKSKIILDIGANSGFYSLISATSNPSSQVHSFEPNDYNYNRLRQNTDLNNLRNITLNNLAVGSNIGALELTFPATSMLSDTSSADESFSKSTYNSSLQWKKVLVQQTTIDAYKREQNIKVDLFKIDVEGF